jgi:hypothetical protein
MATAEVDRREDAAAAGSTRYALGLEGVNYIRGETVACALASVWCKLGLGS